MYQPALPAAWHLAILARGRHSYLDVAANPKKLMRAIWSLLRGRSPAWLRADPTYSSGSARQVLLNTEQSFVLDGEVLETGPAQSLEISAGPVLSFLQA